MVSFRFHLAFTSSCTQLDPVNITLTDKSISESTLAPTIEPPVVAATVAEPAAAVVSTTADTQPQIATFDEWTKQKLQPPTPPPAAPGAPLGSAQGGATPAGGVAAGAGTAQPPPGGAAARAPEAAAAATATRNYASRECGAKVIYSNPEAENTKAVLNDKVL